MFSVGHIDISFVFFLILIPDRDGKEHTRLLDTYNVPEAILIYCSEYTTTGHSTDIGITTCLSLW